MNTEDIRIFRERWKAVEAVERDELKSLSMDQRLKQMTSLWGLGRALGFSLKPDKSELQVFARWARLRAQK